MLNMKKSLGTTKIYFSLYVFKTFIQQQTNNVCFKKTGTKGSSVLLLPFVPVFLKQTLLLVVTDKQILVVLDNLFMFCIKDNHSMARANLNKSEVFLINTTAASKYKPRRPKI